ncbi:ABC transporter substrate-binding protein, partial [Bacillus vallismortis]|nr:ABC transporter substrate-binding protein [Bacillus vallismortis]
DGKVYTFHLRKNVKFSEGTTFISKIFKKNFDSILKHPELHSWLVFMTNIVQTKIIDDHTFQLTLTVPYYPTIQELAV